MKRFINLRLPVILACFLIAGIATGYLFIKHNINPLSIIAVVPVSAVIFILFAILNKKKTCVITVLCALIFICGWVNSYIRLHNYEQSIIVNGGTYSIEATVCEKGTTDYGEYIILNNATADGVKLKGKIYTRLGTSYGDFCDEGYIVKFTAELQPYELFTYGSLNYNSIENIKYYCSVYGGMNSTYSFSLFSQIRSALKSALYDNLDTDTAGIAFAMLTGNTQGVDDGVLSGFRYGGIAHIFAVSGLHIAIIFGLLYFICRKLKLNKYLTAVICLIPVFAYIGICGFTLSSVRAAVMCSVAVVAKLLYKKYDSLNSLCIAVMIILFIAPLSLYSVGFQLSACSVAAIILLSKNLSKPFKRLPNKVTSAVTISLSAQAGTLPVLLTNFGYISGAGLILNILIIPVMSVIYLAIFISVIISLILPFASCYIMPFACLPLQAVVSFFVNAGFENLLLSGFGAGAFVPVFYLCLLAMSDKFNLKFYYRLSAICCAAGFLCTYVLMKTLSPFYGYKIVISADYGGGEVLIKSGQGNVLIITEGISTSSVYCFLNENYSGEISALIVTGGENCISVLDGLYAYCDDIYVFGNYINLQPYENVEIKYSTGFTQCGIDFYFEDGYSIYANCGGVKIAVCAGDLVPFKSCDLLVSDNSKNDCICTAYVAFNERRAEYNVFGCGNFVYYAKDGKLIK